jgi:molecular chaperone GrpE
MAKSRNSLFGKKEKKDDKNMNNTENLQGEQGVADETENLTDNATQATAENADGNDSKTETEKIVQLEQQVNDFQDKYIRLMAEFDNFRKRSLKERSELIKTAGEDILTSILPVIDDFERGLAAMEKAEDVEAVKIGVTLIYSKFKEFLSQRGVKEIEAVNQNFDVDLHEALTKIPAPSDELKGKVVDVIQKGYYLQEKVIRYSKVVVGE